MAGITQKSFETLFPLWSLKKNRGGVYWFRTKGNIQKAQNRGWYSKWYWHCNNPTTINDNKNDDNTPGNDNNTPASAVTATVNHCWK